MGIDRRISSGAATGRRGRAVFVAGLACVLTVVASGAAYGDSAYMVADNDPDAASFFTLDFGEYGGVSTAAISATYYMLELDAESGTAAFNTYHQDVEPLMLPGGVSTGNLTIEVVEGSSSGTYDPVTGDFVTAEVYAVHFDGDLSMFGIESPFLLESTSAGTVDMETYATGTITMAWAGEGALDNPMDPENPLAFSYTCEVNTRFAQAATGDYNSDTRVALDDYMVFRTCFTGPDDGPVGSACAAGDFDLDGDIDLDDRAVFRTVYTGY